MQGSQKEERAKETKPSPANQADTIGVQARLSRTAGAFMLNRRRRTAVLASLAVAGLILAEHLVILRLGSQAHIWFDIAAYMILMPLGLWMIKLLIDSGAYEREKITRETNMRLEFSQKLGNATSWEELVTRVVEYSHQVAPEATATLFTMNSTSLRMDPEATCKRDGSILLKPPPSINPDTLPVGSLPQLLIQHGGANGIPHSTVGVSPAPLPPNRYDLAIMRNDEILGVVKMEFPLGSAPSQAQVRALQSAAPVIGLALEVGMLQKLAEEQAAASTAQRQHIAQNLHDSLAQNISYLRLKLDQLTGENAIQEIGGVLPELERMRATADEAYQQVRSTLDELDPVHAEDLASQIIKQARVICDRANIELRISRVGTPFTLPPGTRQQVLYIVREALHNIEKHSQAREVLLQHFWLESEFILKICDNGVGFNPRTILGDGHYGLWIMQHRAQEIGGTVKIVPTTGEGTEVTLWIPRPGIELPPVN
jgi:signal transduction histidine kinase